MPHTLTYKAAGVDIEEAEKVIHDIAGLREQTEKKRKLFQAFGLFSASYDLSHYTSPVIFTACDGVGTKIQLLLKYDLLEYAGIDLVAMNVNDILTSNAQPLLFLDYIGTDHINRSTIQRVIKGIVQGLEGCDCILAGGETAEMPGLVDPDMIELSGFCVGAAEKDDILDPLSIQDGDTIIGLPSNGLHANGWSLIRKIIEENPKSFADAEINTLLAPTRIYYPEVMALNKEQVPIKGMAHITGGGIPENFTRILKNHGARLKLPKWGNRSAQKVLSFITPEEAIQTFNMGVGWMMVADARHSDAILSTLPEAICLGEVTGTELIVEQEKNS